MSAISLREAVEQAFNQSNPKQLIELIILLRAHFSEFNDDNDSTPLDKFPRLLENLFAATSFIAQPIHEFFHKDNHKEVAAFFSHLLIIDNALKEKNITISSNIRAMAAAIVGDEHVDEMIAIGFNACCERRADIVAAKKQAYTKQLALAVAAQKNNLALMTQLIESGAEVQGPVEDQWLDKNGKLKMRDWQTFYSATAAVIWCNHVDALKLLLTHPNSKNKINLQQLFEQIVIHNIEFNDTSLSIMDDKTIDNAKVFFKVICAETNMSALEASRHFCALVKNHARTIRAIVYWDTPIQVKLLLFYRVLTERYGHDIGKNPELSACAELLASPYSMERYDTFAKHEHVIRQVGYVDALQQMRTHAELSNRYVTYRFDAPTLVDPMIQYLDDNKKPLVFAIHHADIRSFLSKLSSRNFVAEALNTVLYSLSGVFFTNQQQNLKEAFKNLIDCDHNREMEKFFDELMKRIKDDSLNLPCSKWQALVAGYIEALENRNPELVAKLNAFVHPKLPVKLSSNISCDDKDWVSIDDDGVEANPNNPDVELKPF